MNAGRVIWGVLILICAAWVCFVTVVIWNMDPKFGGPHGWGTFQRPAFWVLAWLPSAHLAFLAFAIRFRWRRMMSGALAFRSVYSVSAPIVFVLLSVTYLSLMNGVRFYFADDIGYFFKVFDMPVQLESSLLISVLAFYATCFVLFLPISSTFWGIAILGFVLVFIVTGVLAEWLTDIVATPVEGGTKYSRVRPVWITPIEIFLDVFAFVFAIAAAAQVVTNIVMATFFWVFARPKNAPKPS
ncbi:MAG: hypothetical protein AAF678_06195 [Pseudomonadota bacterium]